MSVLVLSDKVRVLAQCIKNGREILSTRKLTSVDRGMQRDLTILFKGTPLKLAVSAIDAQVNAGVEDSYTFGTVREMFANDVYLRAFKPSMECQCALDLGCNRGAFSLILRKICGASTVIGVEPMQKYSTCQARLAADNDCVPPTTYWKMIGSERKEKENSKYVSIPTIMRDQNVQSIDFAKIDIEGSEAEIIEDTAWLSVTNNIAMELHPHMVDVKPVIMAVGESGFSVRLTNQFGVPCEADQAMFLYASRNGSLII